MLKYECHCVSRGDQMLHDVYFADEVDARIAELEKALRIANESLGVVVAIARTNASGAIQHAKNALKETRTL